MWMLVLIVVWGWGPDGIPGPQFATEDSCDKAGQEWVKEVKEEFNRDGRYLCFRTRE